MKIARWESDSDGISEGFIISDRVVPFSSDRTVAVVLAAGLDAARELHAAASDLPGAPLESIRLLAPIVPASVRDFVAFEEHVEGVSASVDGEGGVVPEWYDAPTFYFTNPHTVRATGDVISTPPTDQLDFELELAVVMGGTPLENPTPSQASTGIFGYTVMNDWSARDLQAREMKVRLGPAKGKDFGITLGPWIVTADELEPFLDDEGLLALRAEVHVNGDIIGEDLISNMAWTFPELVAYAARNSIVVPGDVLGSGTVGNGGCLGELWGIGRDVTALRPGDEVRMLIEGVGEIVNIVGQPLQGPPLPAARSRPRTRRRQPHANP